MASNDGSSRDPEQIRDEIRQTRAHMDKTLDALEARLSPERLKREAAGTIRSQTVGRVEGLADDTTRKMKEAGDDVFETIKENPVPSALVAIGLGWLFMKRNQGSQQGWQPRQMGRERRYGYGYSDADYGYPDRPGAGYRYADRPMVTQEYYPEGSNQGGIRDAAGQAAGKAQEVAGQAQDMAQQVAGTAQDKMQQFSGAAQEQAGRVRNRFEEMMDENPLLMGAAALALGAVVGMSLPGTPQEDALIGSQRDKLMDKAQSAASDTVDKVQQVAQRATDAAKDEAQRQNLTTSSSGQAPRGTTFPGSPQP